MGECPERLFIIIQSSSGGHDASSWTRGKQLQGHDDGLMICHRDAKCLIATINYSGDNNVDVDHSHDKSLI